MTGLFARITSRLARKAPPDAEARPGRRRFLALSALAPLFAAAPALAKADATAAAMDMAGHGSPGHAGHGGSMAGGMDMSGHGAMDMPGHGTLFPWRDPAIAITAPPRLTGKGTGVVITPHLPSLGYEMDGDVKVFRLTAQPVERLLLDGPPARGTVWERWHAAMGGMHGMDIPKKVRLWGFNGSVPGPAIEVVQGDRVRIVVKNELPEPTSIHWHGLEVPNGQDGVGGLTQPPIRPGQTYTYEFTVHQVGTYMYHSSFNEKKQVGMGLGGFFISHPADGSRRVDRDFAILLQEWFFLPGNPYVDVTSTDPNWFTMNGKAGPSTAVLTARVGQTVRIRFANLSNMHAHPIHLHGVTWRVTGTEGGPIPESAQWPGNTVNVAPGTARDVEFTFTNPGYWHMHCHKLHHVVNAHASVPMGIMGMGGMTMLFDVAAADGDAKPAPAPMDMPGHGSMPGNAPAPGPAAPDAPAAAPHAGHGRTGGQ
ncbi:multicopper oxidase type 3 [Solidesulfovibrio carbinoliphilus subsp. oakridgensis]|uniref:Multicopper oxidase type 3 n=1 Tax=Solidesulfovibrio carbinoliphilus subsp. oakridgensis TaxID=694327 RepID=G7Q745_9BACT|nr:copper oxidase [Solidesulfovibrio carbinoliphilus]EHJ49002.1 multicopper oxidase type 3 [Solidesulfovibrio carbinoliphilus subsp. oakridgensis]